MKLCDLVTYGDSLETVIHNLKISLWQEDSRNNGYTTEYGNSYKQLLEWLEELKTRRETIDEAGLSLIEAIKTEGETK